MGLDSSGRDFLQACKLRINALPSKSRTTRGRPEDRQCRTGCHKGEILNHVLQQCHRTHVGRIKRHDAIVSFVSRLLEVQGYDVSVEPKIKSDHCLRKSDIIAKLSVTAMVLDAQVVNDQISLDDSHQRKGHHRRISELPHL